MSEELLSSVGSGWMNDSIDYKRDENGRLVEKEEIQGPTPIAVKPDLLAFKFPKKKCRVHKFRFARVTFTFEKEDSWLEDDTEYDVAE
jgi:hypothetical protein